jgi:hypothetical protein
MSELGRTLRVLSFDATPVFNRLAARWLCEFVLPMRCELEKHSASRIPRSCALSVMRVTQYIKSTLNSADAFRELL